MESEGYGCEKEEGGGLGRKRGLVVETWYRQASL